jgi:hypothetical protein|nr:MAG TPA: homing endonuclease [Caudoviricetes sp.]
MKEIWKDIPLLSRYQISSLGRVKSKQRSTKCNKGVVNRKERLMTPQLRGKQGYACVRLRTDIGVTKTYSIHRLVAQAFIPNPENKPTVDHINRDRLDNRVENLRWATYSEQQSNKIVSTGQVKIPVKAIDKSGNVYYYDGVVEASKALNVDTGTICKVLSNKYINKTGGGYYFEKN